MEEAGDLFFHFLRHEGLFNALFTLSRVGRGPAVPAQPWRDHQAVQAALHRQLVRGEDLTNQEIRQKHVCSILQVIFHP